MWLSFIKTTSLSTAREITVFLRLPGMHLIYFSLSFKLRHIKAELGRI